MYRVNNGNIMNCRGTARWISLPLYRKSGYFPPFFILCYAKWLQAVASFNSTDMNGINLNISLPEGR